MRDRSANAQPTTLADTLAERGFVACRCGAAQKRTGGPWACGRRGCNSLERGGRGAPARDAGANESASTSGHPARSKPRAGKAAEDALAALLAGPYIVVPFKAWILVPQTGPEVIVREYEWGIGLEPRRRFRCDFLHLASGVMAEIEGGAHGVQRQRKHDVLRDQLAQQAGYRIVRVLPEQVHNGEALALVRRATGGEE